MPAPETGTLLMTDTIAAVATAVAPGQGGIAVIRLSGPQAQTAVQTIARFPGRQEWEATTAAEFLARTILRERDYYSKLRVPALVALTWCLGRPRVDPDPAWVREWLGGRGS